MPVARKTAPAPKPAKATKPRPSSRAPAKPVRTGDQAPEATATPRSFAEIEGMRMVPLASIVPGRAGIDPRRVQDEDGMVELVASLSEHGLISPLIVRAAGNVFEVIDGNRRLAALRMIRSEDPDVMVPVVVGVINDATAREQALAANIIRVPLHPLDQCDAFEAMVSDGRSEADIATHFGIAVQQVRRARALAALHEDVKAAWSRGDIDEDQARAFSAGTQERQAAFLKTMLETASGSSFIESGHGIRNAMTQSMVSADHRLVKFVGVENYIAAGGPVRDDLFAEKRRLLDPQLLERLAIEQLRTEAESIRANEGWGASSVTLSMSNPGAPDVLALADPDERVAIQNPSWTKDAIEARKAAFEAIIERIMDDPAEKARRGIVVQIGWNGEVLISRGHLIAIEDEVDENAHLDETDIDDDDTEDGTASDPVRNEPTHVAIDTPETGRVSKKLAAEMADWMGKALGVALVADPRVALAAAVAGLTTYRAPVRVGSGSVFQRTDKHPSVPLATLLDHDTDALLAASAVVFAGCVHTSLTRLDEATPRNAITDLLARLPAEPVREAVLRAFDARAYFAQVNAAQCREALMEIDGVVRGAPSKKADLTAHCVSAAERSGWLPPEMRHPHYIAPRAGEAASEDEEAE